MQEGRDAAALGTRCKTFAAMTHPVDLDTWLVKCNDPVLPAVVVVCPRGQAAHEYFVTLRWGLKPENRRIVVRYASLHDAHAAGLHDYPPPVAPVPNEV